MTTHSTTSATSRRAIIGALTVAGVLLVGCTVESTPTRDAPSSGSNDRATVTLAWSTLSASEQSDVCDEFWVMEDADIVDFLMSPPDAMSRNQADAFVDLLWEQC